jgi:ABC-type Fe3+/spermidine/putrescine transport system ATPase subunit
MKNIILKIESLTKNYGNIKALENVSLDIYEGEFFGVIGPSGSGKSTLLKIISGVETATAGSVIYKGKRLGPPSPECRDIVMVWQSLALFPHMDVAGNVAFGLGVRNINREEMRKRVKKALTMIALDGCEKRKVHELSGGEQQRVALARALVVHPKVLLLDEPLGSLDVYLRGEIQVELRRLHHDTGITFVMVTHDQSEALALCNRIAIINSGRIEQVGTPMEIMRLPQTAFVARFVGDKNVFEGVIKKIIDGIYFVETEVGLLKAARTITKDEQLKSGMKVAYIIEASHIHKGDEYENVLQGIYLGSVIKGSSQIVRIQLQDKWTLKFEIIGNQCSVLDIDKSITISWDTEKAYVLPT